jgi:hypothetical protein
MGPLIGNPMQMLELHDRLPAGDLLCIARRTNLDRTEAIPKKLSVKDKVSREATACLG